MYCWEKPNTTSTAHTDNKSHFLSLFVLTIIWTIHHKVNLDGGGDRGCDEDAGIHIQFKINSPFLHLKLHFTLL